MSTGQAVGGVVGAVAGFAIAGPTGALYGAQLGMAAGGYLDPPEGPTQEGPRLSDLRVQTSTYGANIPRVYGTVATSGNVFWLENNKLKEVVKKKKSGGKGGGSSVTTKTYSYFATFAVGLCQGPIDGVRRIWVGADLMYDSASTDLETAFTTGKVSKYFTVYNGSDTQLPDSRMQADIGAANCPAYRGLAYIVVKDLPLAKYGNSLAGAQIRVEVQGAAGFVSAVVGEVLADRELDSFGSTCMSYFDSNGTAHLFSNGVYFRKGLTGSQERVAQIVPPISSNMAQSHCTTEPLMVVIDYPYHKVYNSVGALVAKIGEPHIISAVSYINGYYYFSDGRGYAISPGYAGETRVYEFSYAPQIDSVVTPVTQVYSGDYSLGSTIDDIYPIDGAYFCLTKDMNLQKRDASFAVLWSHDMAALYSLSGGAGWGGGDRYMIRANDAESCILFRHSLDAIYRATESGVTNLSAAGLSTGFYEYGGLGGATLSGDTLISCTVGVDPGPAQIRFVSLNSTTTGVVTLGEIVETEALLSGILLGPDLDLDDLTQPVAGYIVPKAGSIRSAIEPLRSAWPFDLIQSGYKLKAIPRGQSSVADAAVGDLGTDEQLRQSREMDIQLPQRVTVRYLDSGRAYDTNEQSTSRDNTESVNVSILDLPIVMSADQAAQVSERLIRLYMMERTEFTFTLPPTYGDLEPGDVVTITASYGVFELRLVTINYTSTGELKCTGRPNNPSTYTSTVTGDSGLQDPDTITVEGGSTALLIDCAVVDESVQDAPGFILAMYGASSGWSGGTLYRSADGNTWDDLQGVVGSVPAGVALNSLAAHDGHLIDLGSTLSVQLYAGDLESVTESQMLNGANIAAYGINGRWEIIRFMNAVLEIDGTYTLSGLWRGDRGTEWATGLHEDYDQFALISDADAAFIGTSSDQIGVSRDYRAITGGADIDSALTQTFTYAGENLECLSGVQAKGVRASGDLTITWQRRTRVGGAWRSYVDASLGEAVEAYQIDIYNGPSVVRTISTSTTSATYSAADQTTDFGSPQASIDVKIYQMSAAVGRGHPLEVTL